MANLTADQLRELKKIFDYLDLNKDGSVSYDEFREAVGEYHAQWAEAMIDGDRNADGRITWDEFIGAGSEV